MRIRKRKVPLPLSLLSPVPLSDPHLLSRSPVLLVQELGLPPSLSSDHLATTTTCLQTNSTSDLRRGVIGETTSAVDVMGCEDVIEGVVQTCSDDASNAGLTTTGVAAVAQGKNDNGPLLLSLSNNEGRWCDDDKAVPLKKRRGVELNSRFVVDDDDMEKDMITTTATTMIMMKWKTDDDEEEEEEEKQRGRSSVAVVAADDDTSNKDYSAKKGNGKRGSTILEGSRCSRVNGRGWRCCQPTLVGYSLCEHHLGKGRLRSMTSSGAKSQSSSAAKRKSSANSTSTMTKLALGRDDERDTTTDNDDNGKKLERMSSFGNKRVKLGVVKARSLSSLLGQTNTMNNIVEDHANIQQFEKVSNSDDH